MGEANYNYLLKHVYLLPLDAKQVEMLGQTELARARAMESMLPILRLPIRIRRARESSKKSGRLSESLRKSRSRDGCFSKRKSSGDAAFVSRTL